MATHRPSLNASGGKGEIPWPASARFNGHSSAIPQCIEVMVIVNLTPHAMFQWPLIGHPSMHPDGVTRDGGGTLRVSMATHRPSLNASRRSSARSRSGSRPFQWPLIGHPSMHRNYSTLLKAAALRVSMATHRPSLECIRRLTSTSGSSAASFNGHSSAIPQCIAIAVSVCYGDEVVSMATHRPSLNASPPRSPRSSRSTTSSSFQWPLIGHPSMHPQLSSGRTCSARGRFNGHSSAIPQCISRRFCVSSLAACWFQWPLIGHPSMHRGVCVMLQIDPRLVSMATHRPSLNASSITWTRKGWRGFVSMATHRPSLNASRALRSRSPTTRARFQWPLIGHPSMHHGIHTPSADHVVHRFNGHSSAIPQCIVVLFYIYRCITRFNGHSSAIPQCIDVHEGPRPAKASRFQWPLIGHPSMHREGREI